MGSSRDEPGDEWAEPPPKVDTREAETGRASVTGEIAIGTVFGGRYKVTGVLGEGGFGKVYNAEHTELGSPVALKVLKKELTQDPTLFKRFQQEARTAAGIGHPNIVQVFDLGMDQHGAYIAMEKLEGEELGDRADREHPLSEAYITRVGAEIADAISAAHDAGVVHRDLKPQNVFVIPQKRREDAIKVIDFGIAKLIRRVDEDLTKTGQLFGTPRYMAPEQLRGGKHVDGRADIYAIGALLYRISTNAYPFDGESYPELLLKIMADEPQPVASFRPDFSPRLVEIIDRAMMKSPDARFASAREMADALYDHLPNAATEPPKDLPPPPSGPVPKRDLTPLASRSEKSIPMSQSAIPMTGVQPWMMGAAGVVALLVVGTLGAWAMQGDGTSADDLGATAGDAGAEIIEDPEEALVVAEEVPPAPGASLVHVISTPPGAQIRASGVAMCTAPCDVSLRTSPVTLTAELPGFVTAERTLVFPTPTEISMVLAAVPEEVVERPSREDRVRPPPPRDPELPELATP